MNQEAMDQLEERAAQIAIQMAADLKIFGRTTASLYYARQLQGMPIPQFPDDTEHKKSDNKKANKKLKKMLEEGRQKWEYASDSDKKKVAAMEHIINEGQEKIKALYSNVNI